MLFGEKKDTITELFKRGEILSEIQYLLIITIIPKLIFATIRKKTHEL